MIGGVSRAIIHKTSATLQCQCQCQWPCAGYSARPCPAVPPSSLHLTTMIFCSQCGNQAQGRFCSQCGTALASDAPQAASSSPNGPGNSTAPPPPYQFEPPQESFSPQHQPSRASFTPQYQAPPEPLTALIGSQGQRMPAFFHIASELFIALDQAIAPKGTRGLEANKIAEFRKMGGKSIPQYYESHVLPVYCKVFSYPNGGY